MCLSFKSDRGSRIKTCSKFGHGLLATGQNVGRISVQLFNCGNGQVDINVNVQDIMATICV